MNELSWLIYAADVAGDVNNVCGFLVFGGGIGISIYAVAKGICKVANLDFNEPPVTPSLGSVAKTIWLPWVAAIAVGVLAPSPATFYAIAASEMGESVLKSETGGKAIEALNAWLDKQIAKQ